MIDILRQIEQLRQDRSWSIYELSKQSGIQDNDIRAWYQQDRIPNLNSLEKLSNAFGITLSMLAAESDDLVQLSPEEWKALKLFQCLDREQRAHFLALLESISND